MEKNKNYEILVNIEKQLKFLANSEIRLEILNCIKDDEYSIKEIAQITGLRYSSVSNNMSKLEKNNHVQKTNGKFKMNYITKLHLENIEDFNKSVQIITNFEEFWNKHNIQDINYDSIRNLTKISNSQLVKSTSVDIYKTYNTIKSQMIGSENIQAIFPYLHPDYPKLLENELKNGATIELLINDNIYKNLIFSIDDEIRRKSIKNKKLRVYSVKEPLNIYLAISDNNMSLGLYKNDESFDQNRILISSNKKAIQWGKNLFEDIKNRI